MHLLRSFMMLLLKFLALLCNLFIFMINPSNLSYILPNMLFSRKEAINLIILNFLMIS